MDDRAINEFMTIPDVIAEAKRNLSLELWDHVSGGASSETTVRRNREALDRITFRPRFLRDVSHWTTEVHLLGHTLAMPILLAPVGSIVRCHPDGALAVARVAGRMGIIGFVGIHSSPSLEEAIKVASGPMFFQLYVGGDRAWIDAIVRRVEAAGYDGLCVTVDSPHKAFRDRDRRSGFRQDKPENSPNIKPVGWSTEAKAKFTWQDLQWLRSRTQLPLILKGILTPEDALLAVEHGVDVVYVSNHGGRELDHTPATVDVLESIIQVVGDRVEVIVDSGFLRGTDVLKGVALGARAVGIGKLLCWALAAGGEAGLQRTLEILQEEMDATMGNLGVTNLAELGPEYLSRNATPVGSQRWEDFYPASQSRQETR